MIDLHSHILPGIDDGAADIEASIAIARASVANGASILACTPHITPGIWHNTGPQIRSSVAQLQSVLDAEGIELSLVTGADVHIAPDLVGGIRDGRVLTLHDTRYILLELPHHVAPPHADTCFFDLMAAGYTPIFTHPERLSWIEGHYKFLERLFDSGVWVQITAGSLMGAFGKRAQYWAEKMLAEGLAHILASDTHDVGSRAPVLAEGREIARRIVGDEEANNLVVARPKGILSNTPPNDLPLPAREREHNVRTKYTGPDRDPSRPSDRAVLDWMRRFID